MKQSEELLRRIREHGTLTRGDKASLIVSLSLPSMLAQLSSILMFYIDAAMVGHLGAQASASIGLVETSLWLLGGMTSAAAMGFSVQVAHAIGANDFVRARQILRQALLCTMLFALCITVAAASVYKLVPVWLGGNEEVVGDASIYFLICCFWLPFMQIDHLSSSMLKCAGDMKTPSVMNIIMCVLDVVFNYLFIFQLDMGVKGAALGTLVAAVITSLTLLYRLLVRNKHLSLRGRWEGFSLKGGYAGNAAKIGVPIALQHIMMSGAQIVSTIIVAPLGTVALAAHSLSITAESLCYMPGYGMQDAATTLTGQSMGAGRRDLCRSFGYMTVFGGMLVMSAMGLLMYIFAPQMIGLMTPVDDIVALGSQVLRIEAFAEPMFAASIVAYGVMVGMGDSLRPMIVNGVCMWGVRLTLAAALAPVYGLKGVWIAMATELSVRGIVYLLMLYRKLKKVEN